jgi:hypothetical protein
MDRSGSVLCPMLGFDNCDFECSGFTTRVLLHPLAPDQYHVSHSLMSEI